MAKDCYSKNNFKQNNEGRSRGVRGKDKRKLNCFKCGKPGHFASIV